LTMHHDGFPAGLQASSRRVLVVDDEAHILADLRRWLEQAGWSVTVAQTSSEALRAAQSCSFSVAVVDWRLSSGDEGIRLGRVLHRRWGVPFLLISGYLSTPVVVEAIKAGALDVIDKPLSENRFLTLFQKAASVLDDVVRPASFVARTPECVQVVKFRP